MGCLDVVTLALVRRTTSAGLLLPESEHPPPTQSTHLQCSQCTLCTDGSRSPTAVSALFALTIAASHGAAGEGYHRIERRSDWQRRKADDGVRKHHRQSWMTWKTHNGIENLSMCAPPCATPFALPATPFATPFAALRP